MQEEKLGYRETAQRFEIRSDRQVRNWERIYLTEGPEGFAVERRGRGSTGRPRKLPRGVEEELLAEVQRLSAENEYLKNSMAASRCFIFMYFLLPHWVPATWRSRAQTSMRAELPSGKLPTTRVRRRIFSRRAFSSGVRFGAAAWKYYCRILWTSGLISPM